MPLVTRTLIAATCVAATFVAATCLLPVVGAAQASNPIQLAQLFGQPRQDDSELVARMGRLENQIRQLTGMIEELQHRNRQLEQQLQRVQQDTDFRFQEMNPGSRTPQRPGQSGAAPRSPLPPVANAPDPQGAPQPGGRRGDAFDPNAAPNAPGVPRPLGTIPGGQDSGGGDPIRRGAGSPLDLGSLAGPGQEIPPLPPAGSGAGLPPPPASQQPPAGQQAVLAPSGSPKDEYDLAYGAILRRDYDLADQGFRTFLANHSSGQLSPDAQRLVPDAFYWLGESLYQRQKYNDAAETFLDLYNKYPNSLKAPDALLRLGQSLAALGKQEAACASLGAAVTKYPKASSTVKRAIEQEQKRARC